jgi:hypothetical protein
MKNIIPVLAAIAICCSSCQAIATIFKAGMWWGIILVVLVIAIVLWLVSRAGGGSKN